MKKILTVIAAIALLQTAFAQDGSNFDKVVKDVEKAQANAENPKKAEKPDTWIKLANSLIDAYTAPFGQLRKGASRTETALFLRGMNAVRTEEVSIMGTPCSKEVFPVVNLYYTQDGVLLITETTKPAVPGALDRAAKALAKAKALDLDGKKAKNIDETLKRLIEMLDGEANNCYNLSQFGESSKFFEKIYDISRITKDEELDKYGVSSLFNAGIASSTAKDTLRTESLFEKCVDLGYYGNEGGVFINLYYLYSGQKRFEDARAILERGYELDPENKDIPTLLIDAYNNLGKDPKEVMTLIEKVEALRPNDPYPSFAKGNIYLKMKDYDAALASFKKSQEINPSYWWGFYGEATVYESKGNEILEKANVEMNDRKYEALVAEFNQCVVGQVESLSKAFKVCEDLATKKEIAKLVKDLAFRLRAEEKYQAIYDEYKSFVDNN